MSMAPIEELRSAGPLPNVTSPDAAVPAPASTAAVTPPVATTTGATPDPRAAGNLFGNYADGPIDLQPRSVKTQTIRPDTAALTTALANASGLQNKQLTTASDTAGQILQDTGVAGVTNLNQAAYILATARRESLMGNLMNEGGGNTYFEKKYGHNTDKGEELGNTEPGDGSRYHGRGLVQITGRTNYTKWNDRLRKDGMQVDGADVDLVNNPEQATNRNIASRVLVEGMRDGTFTGKKVGSYVNDGKTDFRNARRVVNGLDHADEIAEQATRYQGILNTHSDAYASTVLKGQMSRLPSGQEAGQLTAPTLTSGMLDPTLSGGTPQGFVKPHQLLRNNLGRFQPAAAPKKLTTLKTKPVTE